MKFTHSLPRATIFCYLLALPITLATTLGPTRYPYCDISGQRGCECDTQLFTCDPFSTDACGSIYLSPDAPNKVNVPWEVAKDSFTYTKDFVAGISGDPSGLISLPFKLVNNGKPNDYDVDPAFVKGMKMDVQNNVAQAVSQEQMADLYEGIVGNNAAFKNIALGFDNYLYYGKDKDLKVRLITAIQTQIIFMINQYPSYESASPMIDPTTSQTGTKTGANGWGIYYSVFVDQLLIAFLQDIAVTGKHNPTASILSQQDIVYYGWKGMKHASVLIDTYVTQRESDITGPDSTEPNNSKVKSYEIKDNWAYYQGSSNEQENCSWDEDNLYEESYTPNHGPITSNSCDDGFVETNSIHCKEGRRQFVTGPLLNNWNLWLLEPAKHWAKLIDLICDSGDTDNKILQGRCKNQGEDNAKFHQHNGGTAIEYMKNKEEVIDEPLYVLGPENTNDCPEGSLHVIERDQCHDAYNQLAKTIEGLKDEVDSQVNWKTNERPRGCFVYLYGNVVNFNPDINDESGAAGDTLGGDQPICYSYPKKNGYIIQRTCQKNYPGGNVIATPVPCVSNGVSNVCNDYYKSTQLDASRTMPFIDGCNTGLDDRWTCCLDSSWDPSDSPSQTPSNPSGSPVALTSSVVSVGSSYVLEPEKYVLGPENTNDCPAGSSHVIGRDWCYEAYYQLAKTMEGLKENIEYPGNWGTGRPSGCFFYLFGNVVHFNPDINNEPGAGGDTLGGDRTICRRTFFVLGPKDTNDCPLGTVPVIHRNKCRDAYNQLATTMEGINDEVNYVWDWGTERPNGCFLDLATNNVNFNTGAGGDTLGGDQTICYNYNINKIVSPTSSVVSGISAPKGINTEQQFDATLKSETEKIVEEGISRHRRIEARSGLLPSGCEYVVATKSDQLLATSPGCTNHFSGTELSGVTFCYVFTIILSDASANAETCSTNRVAELVVRALKHLTDGWYENTIGPVNNVAIAQLNQEPQYEVTTNENTIGPVNNVTIVQLYQEPQYEVTTNMKKTSKNSKK